MRDLYSHRFTLPNGVTVCIPSERGSERGEQIVGAVRQRWKPKGNYFHLLEGGHVEAARRHSRSRVIAKLDLAGFYHQVSRTKVHRGLKQVGISQGEAWEAACDSTVERHIGSRSFSLPFGFVQSPLLASVVLDGSALGRKIAALNNVCLVSAYVDDIIVSSDDPDAVNQALAELRLASEQSGFTINEGKSDGPGAVITAFNIHIGNGRMEITDARMQIFRDDIRSGNDEQIAGILSYVRTVNEVQFQKLSALAEYLA